MFGIVALILLLVLGFRYAPALTQLLAATAELAVALFGLLLAAYVTLRLKQRAGKVQDALRLSAERDVLWTEAELREQIAALFELYWTCRAKGDYRPVAAALSAQHRERLDVRLRRGDKQVGKLATLLDQQFIGLHDYLDDRRDRFEVLIKCRTDIHRVSRIGELLEGAPGLVELHQRWRFIRDDQRWLLSEVKQMDVNAALRDSEVVVE